MESQGGCASPQPFFKCNPTEGEMSWEVTWRGVVNDTSVFFSSDQNTAGGWAVVRAGERGAPGHVFSIGGNSWLDKSYLALQRGPTRQRLAPLPLPTHPVTHCPREEGGKRDARAKTPKRLNRIDTACGHGRHKTQVVGKHWPRAQQATWPQQDVGGSQRVKPA